MLLPFAHGEGCDFAETDTVARLKLEDRILWRYVTAQGEVTEMFNPNGSVENIDSVYNERRNVAGLMSHPERGCESLLSSIDGRLIFESLFAALQKRTGEGSLRLFGERVLGCARF